MAEIPDEGALEAVIPETEAGKRLDQALAALFPDYSRSLLTRWLKEGRVTVDGGPARPRDKVAGGEVVAVTPEAGGEPRWEPEELPLTVLHADDDLLVIDKPAGLVVHPGAGNPSGTLVNALLYHYPELADLPRAGLVHRLDRDTTGLLVVARSRAGHTGLVADLQERRIKREYTAVCHGVPTGGATIDAPMGRHPRDRKRMSVIRDGKPAVTHFTVAERFAAAARLDVRLETGRTHQIRVHLAYRRHPLIGDPVYGRRRAAPGRVAPAAAEAMANFPRQALHAARLALTHPRTGEELSCEAPLPTDLAELLAALRGEAAPA